MFFFLNLNSNYFLIKAELLLILNSDDPYVRPILENGLNKLFSSFTRSTRSTFEINFQNIIKSYWVKRLQNIEPFYMLEELKASLKPIRFNLMFTVSNSINVKNNFDLNNELNKPKKLGNIINRLKNVLANKVSIYYFR